MAIVCKRATFSGKVQGVGFRYTARQIASEFPVTGYVRNLPNGQVEVVAQGASDATAGFLAAITERMGRCIAGTSVQDETPGSYAGFGIRY